MGIEFANRHHLDIHWFAEGTAPQLTGADGGVFQQLVPVGWIRMEFRITSTEGRPLRPTSMSFIVVSGLTSNPWSGADVCLGWDFVTATRPAVQWVPPGISRYNIPAHHEVRQLAELAAPDLEEISDNVEESSDNESDAQFVKSSKYSRLRKAGAREVHLDVRAANIEAVRYLKLRAEAADTAQKIKEHLKGAPEGGQEGTPPELGSLASKLKELMEDIRNPAREPGVFMGDQHKASTDNIDVFALPPKEHQAFCRKLKRDFASVFPPDDDIPDGNTIPSDRPLFRLRLKDPAAAPFYRRGRRLSERERIAAKKFIAHGLRKNILRPSSSPFSSPILFVPKANSDELRVVVDARKLNESTLNEAFPLPDIPELQQKASRFKVTARLDIVKAFWAYGAEDEPAPGQKYSTQDLLAMDMGSEGSYSWKVMIMGSDVSQSVLVRDLTTRVLREEIQGKHEMVNGELVQTKEPICLLYCDDILTGGKDVAEATKNLRQVLSKLQKHKFYVSWKKSRFLMTRCEFLGTILESGRRWPSPEKVRAILDYETPTTKKDLQSFLGLLQYLRDFVPAISTRTKLLQEAARPLAPPPPDCWTAAHTLQFNEIKTALAAAPALFAPDLKGEFVLASDASTYGGAAVLSQMKDEKLVPIEFWSTKWSPAQLSYTITELEELAAVTPIVHRWNWMLDNGLEHTVLTDSRSSTFLMTKQAAQLSRREARMVEQIQHLRLKFVHIAGKQNIAPDTLSRAIGLPAEQRDVFTIVDLCSGAGTVLHAIAANRNYLPSWVTVRYRCVESEEVCRKLIRTQYEKIQIRHPGLLKDKSSEIFNLGNCVKQLVRDYKDGKRNAPTCHLLVCGAPCQPFSRAHRPAENARGLDDPRSLFRETLDIVEIYKKRSPHLSWMIENVEFGTSRDTPHLRLHREEIDGRARELGGHVSLHPLKWFQPTSRVRCLWSNLKWEPYKHDGETPHWADVLMNAKPQNDHRGQPRQYAPAVMASMNSHSDRAGLAKVVRPDGSLRAMTFEEMEAVQGLPTNSTKMEKISDRDRKKILGNAFSAVWVAWLTRSTFLKACDTAIKNTSKARLEATAGRSTPGKPAKRGSGGRTGPKKTNKKSAKIRCIRREDSEPEFKITWEEPPTPESKGKGPGIRSPEGKERILAIFASIHRDAIKERKAKEAKEVEDELLGFRSGTNEPKVESAKWPTTAAESSAQAEERTQKNEVKLRALKSNLSDKHRELLDLIKHTEVRGVTEKARPTARPRRSRQPPKRLQPEEPGPTSGSDDLAREAQDTAATEPDEIGSAGLPPLTGDAWEKEVKAAAAQDEDYQKIVQDLGKEINNRSRKLREARGFSLRDGLIWKAGAGNTVMYLPNDRALIHRFLWHMHDEPGMGSHHGYLRTLSSASRYAWWPTRMKDIYQYARTCEHCQRYSDAPFRLAPHLEMIEPAAGPSHTLTMDFMGPFPTKSHQGSTQALIVQDKFTKLVTAIPLVAGIRWKSMKCAVKRPSPVQDDLFHKDWNNHKNKIQGQPDEVYVVEYVKGLMEVLRDQIFAKYGYPQVIIADNDTKFSRDFQDFSKAHGVTFSPSAVHHQQSNGGTERFMKSAAKALGLGFAGKAKDWETKLLLFVQAYNASTHATTGFAPNILHYGRHLPTHMENVMTMLRRPGTFHELNRKKTTNSWRSYNIEQLKSQAQDWDKAMLKILEMNEREEKRARDKVKQKPPSYKVGDLVLIRPPSHHLVTKAKEKPKWVGPLEVAQTPMSRHGNQHNVMLKRCRSKEHVRYPYTENVDHGRAFTDDMEIKRNIKEVKPYHPNNPALFPVQGLRPTPEGLQDLEAEDSAEEESESDESQLSGSESDWERGTRDSRDPGPADPDDADDEIDLQGTFKVERPTQVRGVRIRSVTTRTHPNLEDLPQWNRLSARVRRIISDLPTISRRKKAYRRATLRLATVPLITEETWWQKAALRPGREPLRKHVSRAEMEEIKKLPRREQERVLQRVPAYLRPGFVPSYTNKRSPQQEWAYSWLPQGIRKDIERLSRLHGKEYGQLRDKLYAQERVKFALGLGTPVTSDEWRDPPDARTHYLAAPEWAEQHERLVREKERRDAKMAMATKKLASARPLRDMWTVPRAIPRTQSNPGCTGCLPKGKRMVFDCRQVNKAYERCNDKRPNGHKKVQFTTGTRRPTWYEKTHFANGSRRPTRDQLKLRQSLGGQRRPRRPTWNSQSPKEPRTWKTRECLPLRGSSSRGHASIQSWTSAYNPPILRGIASRLTTEVKRDVVYAVDRHLRKRAMWALSDPRSTGKASRRHPSRWNTHERKW